MDFWTAVVSLAVIWGLFSMLETGIRNWRKARTCEQNAVLKKAMIDQGFTPEQIVSVIEAGGDTKVAKMAEA